MKKIALSVALVGMLAASGCIDATSVVELKPDGSGRVVETIYMSAAAMGMMGGMMAGMGGEGMQVQAPANPMMDKAKATEKAGQMGEGVAFVSIKEVTKADGSKGAQSIYSFKDISKLKVALGQDDMAPGGKGGGEADKAKEFVTFGYTKGNLSIMLPQPEKDVAEVEEPVANPQEAAMAKQMMAGMVEMFKGMRMRVLVKVPSEIKSTNAKHVGVAPDTKKKQYITLMDMNIDKLLAQPDGMDKMIKMQNTKDQSKVLKMLDGIEGMKVEPSEKVTVKF
jgi:hypothetical protein